MAEQTIQVPASRFVNSFVDSSTDEQANWSADPFIAIDSGLIGSDGTSDARFFRLILDRDGTCRLDLAVGTSSGLRADLSSTFEASGSIEVQVVISSVTQSIRFDIGGVDTEEPYVYPGFATEIASFFTAIGLDSDTDLDGTLAATIILRDFVPPNTDTDEIWMLGDPVTAPATPTGGTTVENHTPTGWTRTEPSPTETQAVWRSERTRTFTSGSFTSATTWGAPTRSAPKLLTLSDLDLTSYDVDCAALITRTDATNLYQDASRGGTDTPTDGEIGIGDDNDALTRLLWFNSMRLVINRSGTINLSTYFGPGGDGANLMMFIVTDAGQAQVPIGTIYPTSGQRGAGFIQFGSDTTKPFPDAMQTLLDGIGVGDRFIFALARRAPQFLTATDALGALSGSADVREPRMSASDATGALNSTVGLREPRLGSTDALGGLASSAGFQPGGFTVSHSLGALDSAARMREPRLNSTDRLGAMASSASLQSGGVVISHALGALASRASLRPPRMSATGALGALDSATNLASAGFVIRSAFGALASAAKLRAPRLRATDALGALVSNAAAGVAGIQSSRSLGALAGSLRLRASTIGTTSSFGGLVSSAHFPQLVPGAARAGEVIEAGLTFIIISWSAPANLRLPITSWEYRIDRGAWISHPSPQRTVLVDGLQPGRNYSFQVRGTNMAGTGPESPEFEISTLPSLAPTPPLFPYAVVVSGTVVELRWRRPANDGGTSITRYEVCVSHPDGRVEPWRSTGGADTRFMVRGLAAGYRYAFRVRAVNSADKTGEPSRSFHATPGDPVLLVVPPGQRIPLRDVTRQSLVLRLQNIDCRVTVWWQPWDGAWYGSLEAPTNTPIAEGVRLAVNSGLLDRLVSPLNGNIVCRALDTAEDRSEPGRDAWGAPSHGLFWEAEQ